MFSQILFYLKFQRSKVCVSVKRCEVFWEVEYELSPWWGWLEAQKLQKINLSMGYSTLILTNVGTHPDPELEYSKQSETFMVIYVLLRVTWEKSSRVIEEFVDIGSHLIMSKLSVLICYLGIKKKRKNRLSSYLNLLLSVMSLMLAFWSTRHSSERNINF